MISLPLRWQRRQDKLAAVRFWLVLLVAALLLTRAAELRLPELERTFWEDEIHHNEPVLASADVAALKRNEMYLAMFQPLLDFWLRKRVWFPLFGVNERALRLPALVFGLALIGLVFTLAWRWARGQLRPSGALCFAAAVTTWATTNALAVHQSAEGRHYAFVMFASVAWCWAIFVRERSAPFAVAAASLLFANAHFFSLPLVALGYGWLLARDARRWPALVVHAVAGALIVYCTLVVNRGPLELLWQTPPGDAGTQHAQLSALWSRPAITAAWHVWRAYGDALALPGGWFCFAALATLLVVVARRVRRWGALLAVVWLVLPGVFAYMRLRSSYDFEPRYFTPFFGVAPVLLLAAFDAALVLWRRVPTSRRAETIVLVAAVATLTLLFGPLSFARGLSALRLSPKNFSSMYRNAAEIREEGRPTFILHPHCFGDDMEAIYYEHILPPPRRPIAWSGFVGCAWRPAPQQARLDAFVATMGPDALIVLDDKEDECRDVKAPVFDDSLSVERVAATTRCVWKLRGVTSRQVVAAIAARVRFPAAERIP